MDPQPSKDLAQKVAAALYERTREEVLSAAPSWPLSTYRVQLHAGFGWKDAEQIVPYLARLGITHLYSSPILRAAPGSLHGYDVVDHTRLNPELGSEADLDALCAKLSRHGLGQLLDVVPNHMGIERGNPLWLDVLENGPASLYAKFFDVDWAPVKDELLGKVLLPVLGDQYGIVLEKGELELEHEAGAFFVRYWDKRFPLTPGQYGAVLRLGLEQLAAELGEDDEDFIELLSILTAIENLPRRSETEKLRVVERNREKQVIKRRLRAVVEHSPRIAAHVGRNVRRFNGRAGEPASFDLLDRALDQCSYRLAYWRVAGEEINYRRFFDINTLAAVRVEDPDVFEHTHRLIFQLVRERKVSGLRIDHPDGLFDPTAYFLDLQERYFVERARERLDEREGAGWKEVERALRQSFREEVSGRWDSPLLRALHVVVEKIQGGRERIPEAWAVHGTVGYRFSNALTGLFVDRSAEGPLTEAYHRFIGRELDFQQLLYEKKRLILTTGMSSEVNVLAHELNHISELDRTTRDFTLNSLRRALIEFIALFPVYRTYVDGWREVDERDVHYVEWTIARMKRKDPTTSESIFDFLRDVLLRRYPERVPEQHRAMLLRFAMKVQQLTGPAMAKGLEDTAFYVFNRLTSLNEVGGEPERFGTTPSVFHLRNQERAEYWPASLLATSTHDTKRSEDVRARIDVISEKVPEWAAGLERWAAWNERHKVEVKEALAPERNDEYLFYQALLGAWPMGERPAEPEWEIFRGRIARYMQKAIREAKVHTSWINPDPDYDAAMERFVERALDWRTSREFLSDFEELKRSVERPGQVNALGQLVLKLASPGVCDLYQGQELWELSLVDPDNRRPVDYARRQAMLEALDKRAAEDRRALCDALWAEPADGAIKLYATAEGLRLRGRHPQLFRRGEYVPLDTEGPLADRIVAFLRVFEDDGVMAVVPRLVTRQLELPGGLGAAYRGTRVHLPAGPALPGLTHVFTGERFSPGREAPSLDAGELFAHCPVALLEKRGR